MKPLTCRHVSTWGAYVAVFALVVCFSSLPALSQIAQPGYDLFQTGSGASVNLGTLVTPSTVDLVGIPIQPSVTGTADTIMYRPNPVPSSCATTPPCTIEVTLYALFMVSSSPVTYNGQSADVYITVNASGGNITAAMLPQCDTLSSASGGSLTLTPNSAGTSGTFNSSITVNADVIIMTHGATLSCMTKLTSGPAPPITLTTTNSSFSTTPPTGSPNVITSTGGAASGAGSLASTSSSTSYPGSGGIYFNPVHTGPHPVAPAQKCTPLSSTSPQPLAKQDDKVVGATPELRICPANPNISN